MQRLLAEKRLRDTSLNHVFLTRFSPENAIGLMGLGLSQVSSLTQRVSKAELTIHGPTEALRFSQYMNKFADVTACSWKSWDYSSALFQDKNLIVNLFKQVSPISSYHDNENDEDVSQAPPNKILKSDNEADCCYAFHFQQRECSIKLNADAIIKLNIPPEIRRSSKMGDLKGGQSIELPDGRVILPSQVIIRSNTSSLLVLECNTPAMADAFANNDELKSFLRKGGESNYLELVVYFVPEEVSHHSSFQKLVDTFEHESSCYQRSTPLIHLVLNGTSNVPSLYGGLQMQAICNHYIDSHIFPLLWTQSGKVPVSDPSVLPRKLHPDKEIYLADPGLVFSLRINKGFQSKDCGPVDNAVLIKEGIEKETNASDNFSEIMKEAKNKLTHIRESLPKTRCFPEVVFLGTASSIPCKYRNVSSFLLHLSEESCIMFDSGEGTLFQIIQLYGLQEGWRILRNLKLIVISHMHADHHLDLIPLLMERRRAFLEGIQTSPSSMCIMGPVYIQEALKVFDDVFKENFSKSDQTILFALTRQYCNEDNVINNEWLQDQEWFNHFLDIQSSLNITIRPVRVVHTGASFGFVVSSGFKSPISSDDSHSSSSIDETSENVSPTWKIVYSGDCRPSQKLAEFGSNCDLLIHEATFPDDLIQDALMKKHSTVSEALQVAKDMKAGFTILNHLSARFNKNPCISEFHENVACSFDFLRVNLHELQLLSHTVPYFKHLFAESYNCLQKRKISLSIEQRNCG